MIYNCAIASSQLLGRVDHLVYATPDLNLAIDKLEKLLGVRATPGGQHFGLGTRNALVALGPFTYLEIVGPDPKQPKPARPLWFGIDELQTPMLVRWAANASDLDCLVSGAALQGVELGAVASGSRNREDGVVLSWRLTDPFTILANGIVPFFIDWGQTLHPAVSAVQGCSLADLRAEHPNPKLVEEMLNQIGLDLRVHAGSRPALIATITSPQGRVELR